MQYHKIQSLFKRDDQGKFILGSYSIPEFNLLQGIKWRAYEKVNGTNARIYLNPPLENSQQTIFGRTNRAVFTEPQLEKLREVEAEFKQFAIDTKLPDNAILYGELYGSKIQSGGHYSDVYQYVAFDIRAGKNLRWAEHNELNILTHRTGLEVAPLVKPYYGSLNFWLNYVAHAKEEDKLSILKNVKEGARSEGLILKPILELNSMNGRVITKLKFKDFE